MNITLIIFNLLFYTSRELSKNKGKENKSGVSYYFVFAQVEKKIP